MNTNFTILNATGIAVEVDEYEASSGAVFTIRMDVSDDKNDVTAILIYTDEKSIANQWGNLQRSIQHEKENA